MHGQVDNPNQKVRTMTSVFETITITNVIHTGSAFGVKHSTGESCFIPTSVMSAADLRSGDTVPAFLVPNPNAAVAHRTPWLVRYVHRQKEELPVTHAPAPEPVVSTPAVAPPTVRATIETFVRSKMLEGGVWTVGSMYREYLGNPEAKRADNLPVYNRVMAVLVKMFDADECAKWSMWAKASQTKPGKEWYSCYPKTVDVAEWEETEGDAE